jgi:hypothetical protein
LADDFLKYFFADHVQGLNLTQLRQMIFIELSELAVFFPTLLLSLGVLFLLQNTIF